MSRENIPCVYCDMEQLLGNCGLVTFHLNLDAGGDIGKANVDWACTCSNTGKLKGGPCCLDDKARPGVVGLVVSLQVLKVRGMSVDDLACTSRHRVTPEVFDNRGADFEKWGIKITVKQFCTVSRKLPMTLSEAIGPRLLQESVDCGVGSEIVVQRECKRVVRKFDGIAELWGYQLLLFIHHSVER